MQTIDGKCAVVLGGAGFLGSWLCERLIALGAARVVAVDDFSTGAEENLLALRGEAALSVERADISEALKVPGEVHFIFNLASPASPVDYDRLWLETMRAGSLGTQHALELAEAKRAVMVQASTSEIYGDPLVHPQSEDYLGNVDSIGPRAVYDEAKRYGEALTQAFRRKRNVSTRIARIFNTYGPRMRLNDGRVVPQFVSQALTGRDFSIYGDGSQTRSFCYAADLVDGLVRLGMSDVEQPVNIGNPREHTILAFAEIVRKIVGGPGKIAFHPLPLGDPRQRKPDIHRAQSLLGWIPETPLESGLEKTVAYFRTRV